MDKEESDRESIRRVQAGETDAFENLILRHEKTIFNLLYHRLGDYDEAADAAQEVFLSAFRSINQFRGESRFSTWLYRIAVNHAKNRWKSTAASRQRIVPLEVPDSEGDGGLLSTIPHPGLDPAQEAERGEMREQIQRGLNGLKADDAMIILLHDLQEVPYEEIARILAIPMGTVKSRLHRARLALKERLVRENDPTRAKI